MLQSTDFEVKYHPGKTDVVADALSCLPSLANISIVTTQLDDKLNWRQAYIEDSYFGPIWNILNKLENSDVKQQERAKHFELQNNRIYLRDGMRLAIPFNKALRTAILKEHHDAKIAGHLGIDKTCESIMRNFYWPKMIKDVRKYILSCDECQRNKNSNQTPAGLLQPLTIPNQRWEHVTMDFIVQLPLTRQGKDAIVVFVDKLTKRAHFHPTNTTITAPEVAKIFFSVIFKNHGLPKVIISDRDAKFTSNFWKALFQQLGTKLSMSTALDGQKNV